MRRLGIDRIAVCAVALEAPVALCQDPAPGRVGLRVLGERGRANGHLQDQRGADKVKKSFIIKPLLLRSYGSSGVQAMTCQCGGPPANPALPAQGQGLVVVEKDTLRRAFEIVVLARFERP